MKWQKIIILFFLLILMIFLNGCFMPSSTHSKGTVSLQFNQEDISNEDTSERFIVVSFWEYPIVNNSRGKVIINEVILTERQQIKVTFPRKGYWAVWTPVLGTQHLAPEPGIMVFHNSYPLRWNIGGTDLRNKLCCEKPDIVHNFEFEFGKSQEDILLKRSKDSLTKEFFENFLAEKDRLMKKIEKCKSVTVEEINMVLKKLKQIEMLLEK